MQTALSKQMTTHMKEWTGAIEGMIGYVLIVNSENGWLDDKRDFGTDIALLHSEVSECFEAFRNNNWNGEKDSVQDELADIFIRLLDTCYRHDVNLTRQFMAKMLINETRGYKHGGKIV